MYVVVSGFNDGDVALEAIGVRPTFSEAEALAEEYIKREYSAGTVSYRDDTSVFDIHDPELEIPEFVHILQVKECKEEGSTT